MCSYMSINGVPSCANEFILKHMIREEWGMPEALIVTDCEAVSSMYQHNHYAKDVTDATAKSLNAGVDLNTGFPWFQSNGLKYALGNGTITMQTVDTALARSLSWKFKLGLFDNPATQEYTKLVRGVGQCGLCCFFFFFFFSCLCWHIRVHVFVMQSLSRQRHLD